MQSNLGDMKTVAYCRVSTVAQTEGNGLSQQRASIASYAAMKSIEIHDWMEDAATGTTDDRPALEAIKEQIVAGEVARVIVDRMDRLGRSVGVCESVLEFFRAHRVEFVCVSQQFEEGTPWGDLQRVLMSAIAQYDRAMLLGRMRACKREAGNKGRFVGGGVPLGYRVGKPGVLEPDPATAPVVRRIFELRDQMGYSYARIADQLYLENQVSATGKLWHASSVMYILKRRDFYAGRATLHTSEKRAKPVHEAIL
jgi:site-specific DNA recombinase